MTDYTATFDRGVERRGTGSYKWDSDPEALPLWVADMDFATAPAVIDALRRRVEQGAFGYTLVGDEYYDAVIRWFARRHGWDIARDSIMYTESFVVIVHGFTHCALIPICLMYLPTVRSEIISPDFRSSLVIFGAP